MSITAEDIVQEMLAGKTNNLNRLAGRIYKQNLEVGWWSNEDVEMLTRYQSLGNRYAEGTSRLIASKIALCHSELSEALEGMRKGLMDDHLPHRPALEVELGDTIIRILDLAGFLNLDLSGAVTEKLEYNAKRLDHKKEVRAAAGGKTI